MSRRSRRLLGLTPPSQPFPVTNEADEDDLNLSKTTPKLERKFPEQLGYLTNAESPKEPDDSKDPEVRPSSLLKLPIELRYMIYQLVVVNHLVIEGYEKEGCCINKEHVIMPGPFYPTASLLRTCRILHEEATKFLYSRDFFVIQHPLDYTYLHTGQMGRLLGWLEKIGPKSRSYLRSITFKTYRELGFRGPRKSGGDANYRIRSVMVAKLLANSANLQRLTTLHTYNTSPVTRRWAHPPSKESKSKDWTHRACMIAEIMYKDFGPMISQAIESGKPLDDILKLLMPREKSFEWYHVGRRIMPSARWTQKQVDEGKAAMAEHMMLLLEKNLAYQRQEGWVRN